MKRKICVVTGSRAEYGLLYWLLEEIQKDPDLSLQLVVTCMHLSSEFGLSYRQIEADGFMIDKKVEMLLSSDTPIGISKSMGVAYIGFADAFSELKPDLVVLLGDRFEMFCAAGCACVARMPIAHIHGGETTQGAVDEFFRHAITKMSHLHFASTDVYRKRIIQLGEQPERVFNVGAIGIENIRRLGLLSKQDLEGEIGFDLGDQYFLVTFHPVTLEQATAETQFKNLLLALDKISSGENPPTRLVFTKANADMDGRIINQLIDSYVRENRRMAAAFSTMGQLRYLSAMKHAAAVVGNSSSGIVEAPSLKVPTVNIGDRQKGRVQAEQVINCGPYLDEIVAAVKTTISDEFKRIVLHSTSPYEKADTAINIKRIIKEADLSKIIKKPFFDLDFSSSRDFDACCAEDHKKVAGRIAS